jgi:hypothetical protein
MNALLTIVIVALALFAWACVFTVVPGCALSRSRYRLWRLRDRLVDAILDDTFEDPVEPQRFLLFVERSITCLPEMSALDLALFMFSSRGIVLTSVLPWDLDRMKASDRAALEPMVWEVKLTVLKHLFTGTPSGWCCLVVLAPILLPVVLYARLGGKRDGKSLVKDMKARLVSHIPDDGDQALALLCVPEERPLRSLFQAT